MRLPIVAGRLRGRWWHPAAGGKLLRVLNGSYEPEQSALFDALIEPGATVFDVGAHVGYYTMLSSQLAGERGHVIAFEPNPRNFAFLQRHVAMNRLANVRVEELAVSDTNGTAHFEFGTGSGTGHLAGDGALTVRTVRLDDYCGANDLRPDAIKIDVEGGELAVLRGAESTLASARPVIFLSTHGEAVHRACMDWLNGRGYGLEPVDGGDVMRATELLCIPQGR